MKIVREGKEIVLTQDELFNAYIEQQHEFDMDSCLCYIDDRFMDEDWYAEKNYEDIKNLADEMAYEYRRNVDKYDMGHDYALDEAWELICIRHELTIQN